MSLQVVIPTYNAPMERLAAAVRSALAVPGIERVWVVDDGSERPVSPAGSLADDRVRILRKANAGPSSARNAALDAATDATSILLLDDDDVLLPEGVGPMVEVARRHRAAAVVAAREHATVSGMIHKPVPTEWAGRVLPRPGDVFRPIGLFGGSGCLIGEPALRAGVRFDPALWHGEDRDFLRRCAEHGPIGVSGAVALRVTIHPPAGTNLTSASRLAQRVRDHLVLLDRHYDREHDDCWQEATEWLLGAVTKGQETGEYAGPLLEACHRYGWRVPLKVRIRLLARGVTRRQVGGMA